MRRPAYILAFAISALILAAGLALDRHSALAAYLVAWIAIGSIPIGALGVLMTSYLVRRAWTEDLHPILIAATATLPVAALLLVPVLIGMKELYPAAGDASALPPFKAAYLAPWFFAVRSLAYLAVLTLLAMWQWRSWGEPERMVRSASIGLIIYALLISFAGIDWVESLEPEFHSSIYGLLYLCFALLNGVAFAVGIGLLFGPRIGTAKGYSALLLSMILLWAYLHAMQYIVIWAANIPDEVTWYLKRSSSGWQYGLALLAFGQLIFPFFALLSARVRSDQSWLLALCVLTLVMRCLEAAILILPALAHIEPVPVAILLAASLAFVGITLGWAFEAAGRWQERSAGVQPDAPAEAAPR